MTRYPRYSFFFCFEIVAEPPGSFPREASLCEQTTHTPSTTPLSAPSVLALPMLSNQIYNLATPCRFLPNILNQYPPLFQVGILFPSPSKKKKNFLHGSGTGHPSSMLNVDMRMRGRADCHLNHWSSLSILIKFGRRRD